MRAWRTPRLGAQANRAAGDFASRVDGRTSDAAQRAAVVIASAVRLLRIPTAVLLVVPLPFIVATLAFGLTADGAVRIVILVAGVLMAVVSAAFAGRRRMILQAVQEPERLATELGILISLSDKVDETRGALSQMTGGDGWRVFGRLQGLWRGASMTGRWIDEIGDLPRARYFAPPKIGTTVTVAMAALWLVPVSVVVAFLAFIGAVAGAL